MFYNTTEIFSLVFKGLKMAKESEIDEVTDRALCLTKEILVPVVSESPVEAEKQRTMGQSCEEVQSGEEEEEENIPPMFSKRATLMYGDQDGTFKV